MEKIDAFCLIADVAQSRINPKAKELDTMITSLNREFHKDLLTNFTVRAGDEIFGLATDFRKGYAMFKELYYLARTNKVSLYVGVGFGNIYKQNLDNPEEVNGPAIWYASDALKKVKEAPSSHRWLHSMHDHFKYFFHVEDHVQESLFLNYYVSFVFEKVMKRTDKQIEAIRLLTKYPHLTYEEIGQKLGYTKANAQVNLSNLLSRAKYRLIKEAEEEFLRFIEKTANRMGNL